MGRIFFFVLADVWIKAVSHYFVAPHAAGAEISKATAVGRNVRKLYRIDEL